LTGDVEIAIRREVPPNSAVDLHGGGRRGDNLARAERCVPLFALTTVSTTAVIHDSN
jgi:hypothetical protein